MGALSELKLVLTVDGQGRVTGALNEVGASVERAGQTSQTATGRMVAGMQNAETATGRMSRSVESAQRLLAELGAGFSLALVIRESLQAALAMERITAAMKATAGSAPAAARELQFIREEANRLGLVYSDTALAYAKFSASTKNTAVEGEATRKIFIGVSEAVTAMKLSGEESNGIFLALSQMMSKGKISAEELTGQLNERLPGATKMAADALGLTTAELLKQMQEGKLMSADVLPKLAEQLHKTYGAAAVEAAGQGQASINRFNNAMFETKAALGTALMPTFTSLLTNVIQPLSQYITMFIGGLEILAVKLAALPDKASAAWKAIKSGEGIFSKNGLAMFDEQMSVITANENSVIADILAKYTPGSSQKTATELSAEQMKVAEAKRKDALARTAANAGGDDQTAQYNRFVTAYNRMIDAIREGDSTISAEEKAVQKLRDQYENLSLEFPKHASELEGLYAAHLKQVESLQALKKAVSDTSIEFQALQQLWDNQPAEHGASGEMNLRWAEELKALDALQPSAGIDKLNEQIAQFEKLLTDIPGKSEEVAAAIAKLQQDFNNASGLTALQQSNSDLEVSLIDDQFKRQQEALDREYSAKKEAYEKELKLASTTAEKRAAIEKALFLERQKYDKDSAKNADASFKSQLSMVSNYAGIAGDLFSKLADSQDQSSREGFEAAKKYATAAAVMNTAAAIMNAMATSSNIYVGIAMAALAAATGAIQIAKIQSTTFGGGDTSVSAPGGISAGAGSSGGGVAGSAIGSRYVSVQDSQTTESLQALADSADNASLAIGKITDGFSKIASMFSDGGYASMYMGNLYGIDGVAGSGSADISKIFRGTLAKNIGFQIGDIASTFIGGGGMGLTAKINDVIGSALFGTGNKFAYKG